MSIKLTDYQLTMLSAAAQRDDRCLGAGRNLKGGAAQKVAARFIGAGLAKEIRAKVGMPVWRRDEAAAHSYALKLTAAGVKAIVVDEASTPREFEEKAFERHVGQANTSTAQQIPPDASTVNSSTNSLTAPAAPRNGTKIAQVIEMLNRNSGATLDELVAATQWLPHTTRAALTGLRKRGYCVALDRSNAGRGSSYRIPLDRAAGDAEVSSGEDAAGNSDKVSDDNPPMISATPLETSKRGTAARARQAA